ncbi:hypothetical protein EVA_12038 [gut metagenome]|uniref:Uncharacterized protein n=1 Tax=gut metagenome TaxID=749906 RepID=J9GDK6_9ZZZZ
MFHDGGFVVGIQRRLVSPFVNQQHRLGILGWVVIGITFISRSGSNVVHQTAVHHLLGKGPGVVSFPGVENMDGQAHAFSPWP